MESKDKVQTVAFVLICLLATLLLVTLFVVNRGAVLGDPLIAVTGILAAAQLLRAIVNVIHRLGGK